MKRRLASLAVLVGLLAAVPTAEAAFITGTITFDGIASPINGGPANATDWTNSTGINYATNGNTVVSGTGDYASVTGGTPVAFTDHNWVGPFPVAPLWAFTFGGNNYSFDLGSIANLVRSQQGVSFTGTGILHITGFTDTPGTFAFATTGRTQGGIGDRFVFAAGNTAVPPVVPEPGSLILLGTGLFGLGTAVRRRSARKA